MNIEQSQNMHKSYKSPILGSNTNFWYFSLSMIYQSGFFTLTKLQNLDWFKLKASADDKIKVLKKKVFDRVENIVEKGENAGYQRFLLFLQCFQNAFYSGLLKVGTVW